MERPTSTQRIGLALLGLMSLVNLPSALVPTPEGEVGPPYSILVLGTVLGLTGLVGVVAAWRGRRWGSRVAVGSMVLAVITSLPAFFVPVPATIKLLVGLATLVTVLGTVLVFSPARRPAPSVVLD